MHYIYTGSMSKLERYRGLSMKIVALIVVWYLLGLATFVLAGMDISVGQLTSDELVQIYAMWNLMSPIMTVIGLIPYAFLYGR